MQGDSEEQEEGQIIPETGQETQDETQAQAGQPLPEPKSIELPHIGLAEAILISIFAWPLACIRAIQELIEVTSVVRSPVLMIYYLMVIVLPLLFVPSALLFFFGLDFTLDNFARAVFFQLFLSLAFFGLVGVSNLIYAAFSGTAYHSKSYREARRKVGFATFISLAVSFVASFAAIDLLAPAFLLISPGMFAISVLSLLLSFAVMAAVVAGQEFLGSGGFTRFGNT